MDSSLVFNGVNGTSGDYLISPALPAELVDAIQRGSPSERSQLDHLRRRAGQATAAPREGIDPLDLSQTGWGVIFDSRDDRETSALRDALGPLLEHRRAQAAQVHEQFYREYAGGDAWADGDPARKFLRRHRVPAAPADPSQMPYYLAIVGPPNRISFQSQFQLGVQRAVGRIEFETLDEYADYARAVVHKETAPPARSGLMFFGPSNADDAATQLSRVELLDPLADFCASRGTGWTVGKISGRESTKSRLAALLGADSRPSILFTASHGMAFPADDSRRLRHQGALLCQDWPGPVRHRGRIPEDYYFSADDMGAALHADGMIAIHFACYSAGTPKHDDFAPLAGRRIELATTAFVAALPQKLLSKGALAVVGHVERAWGYSFFSPDGGRQVGAFEDILVRLMNGHPVGSALAPLVLRYADLASQLNEELDNRAHGEQVDAQMLASLWTESNDARNYIILGDPAVRV